MALFLSVATEASTRRALLPHCAAFLFVGIALAGGQKNVSNIPARPTDAAEVEHEIEQIQALMPALRDCGAAFF
jgi:hypothetical protein